MDCALPLLSSTFSSLQFQQQPTARTILTVSTLAITLPQLFLA